MAAFASLTRSFKRIAGPRNVSAIQRVGRKAFQHVNAEHATHPFMLARGVSNAVLNPLGALAGGAVFGTKRGRLLVQRLGKRQGIMGTAVRSMLKESRAMYHGMRRAKVQTLRELKRPFKRRFNMPYTR